MTTEDEWIDIEKSKNIDEVRNTKEYKDWVKDVKNGTMIAAFYAEPTSTWKSITCSRLRISYLLDWIWITE